MTESEFPKPPIERPESTPMQRAISMRGHWIDIRSYYRTKESEAQRNIEMWSDTIDNLRLGEKTGSAMDVPPLRQTLLENLSERLLRALDRHPR